MRWKHHCRGLELWNVSCDSIRGLVSDIYNISHHIYIYHIGTIAQHHSWIAYPIIDYVVYVPMSVCVPVKMRYALLHIPHMWFTHTPWTQSILVPSVTNCLRATLAALRSFPQKLSRRFWAPGDFSVVKQQGSPCTAHRHVKPRSPGRSYAWRCRVAMEPRDGVGLSGWMRLQARDLRSLQFFHIFFTIFFFQFRFPCFFFFFLNSWRFIVTKWTNLAQEVALEIVWPSRTRRGVLEPFRYLKIGKDGFSTTHLKIGSIYFY